MFCTSGPPYRQDAGIHKCIVFWDFQNAPFSWIKQLNRRTADPKLDSQQDLGSLEVGLIETGRILKIKNQKAELDK